jgi:hypothetical protein
MMPEERCECASRSGDEGPVSMLPGGPDTVVRSSCDQCGRLHYDDAALARLRLRVAAVEKLAERAVTERRGMLATVHAGELLVALNRRQVLTGEPDDGRRGD